jgi:hypothetical protein
MPTADDPLLALVAQIVSAHVQHNETPARALPELIRGARRRPQGTRRPDRVRGPFDLHGMRVAHENAQASSADRAQNDTRAIPREVEPSRRLPHGRAAIRGVAFKSRQGKRIGQTPTPITRLTPSAEMPRPH